MTKGRFITLEGGEGTGKSTQSGLLAEYLERRGIKCLRTREPGGSPGAEQIRDLLVKGDTDRWCAATEALLVTAGRADHVKRTILPALESGTWVICDRFYDSTVAYQGGGGGLGADKIMELQRWALGDLEPDLTLVFDMPVEAGLARAFDREGAVGEGEDRFERVGSDFHNRLRKAYLELAARESHRCTIINAEQTIERVASDIQTIVAPLLENR